MSPTSPALCSLQQPDQRVLRGVWGVQLRQRRWAVGDYGTTASTSTARAGPRSTARPLWGSRGVGHLRTLRLGRRGGRHLPALPGTSSWTTASSPVSTTATWTGSGAPQRATRGSADKAATCCTARRVVVRHEPTPPESTASGELISNVWAVGGQVFLPRGRAPRGRRRRSPRTVRAYGGSWPPRSGRWGATSARSSSSGRARVEEVPVLRPLRARARGPPGLLRRRVGPWATPASSCT
jgi:hypothetical protein